MKAEKLELEWLAEKFQEKYGSVLEHACRREGTGRYEYLKQLLEHTSFCQRDGWLEFAQDLLAYCQKAGIRELGELFEKQLPEALEVYKPGPVPFLKYLFQDRDELKERAEALQEKYRPLLAELCRRNPQERYSFLRSHPLWQEFNEDLAAYYPLVERRYHAAIDPGVLFLSLEAAIRTYELSKGLLFVWIFMKSNFEHRNQLRRELGDAGGMVYANESKLPRIIKLIRTLDQEGELTRSSRSAAIGRVMSYFEKYEPETVSRRAVEDAWDRWRTSIVPMESYDSEGELVMDQTAGKAIEQHQEQEEQTEITDLFEFIFQNPGRLIKETVPLPGKDSDKKLTKRVTLVRYYLTREILKVLKLKTLTRRERDELLREGRREALLAEQGSAAYFRDYMEELHMDARKSRQTAGADEERFYYRWKCHQALPGEAPVAAGNSDVYDALLPYADQVMQVMEKDYIETAVEDGPESLEELEGVYYNLLRQGFRFADKQYNDVSARFRFSKEGDQIYREWARRVKRYVAMLRENG